MAGSTWPRARSAWSAETPARLISERAVRRKSCSRHPVTPREVHRTCVSRTEKPLIGRTPSVVKKNVEPMRGSRPRRPWPFPRAGSPCPVPSCSASPNRHESPETSPCCMRAASLRRAAVSSRGTAPGEQTRFLGLRRPARWPLICRPTKCVAGVFDWRAACRAGSARRNSSARPSCQLRTRRKSANALSAAVGPFSSAIRSSSRMISLRLMSSIWRAPSAGDISLSRVSRRRLFERSFALSRTRNSSAMARSVSFCARAALRRSATGSPPLAAAPRTASASRLALSRLQPPCGAALIVRRAGSAVRAILHQKRSVAVCRHH